MEAWCLTWTVRPGDCFSLESNQSKIESLMPGGKTITTSQFGVETLFNQRLFGAKKCPE